VLDQEREQNILDAVEPARLRANCQVQSSKSEILGYWRNRVRYHPLLHLSPVCRAR
jgi:hypothetical protein